MALVKRARICRLLILLGPLLVAPLLYAADTRWIEVQSPHFSVITDAGDKQGREVAFRLEQMQAVFAGFLLKQELTRPIPLTVIAFRGDKEYAQVAPRRQGVPIEAPAFVLRGEDRDFLVLNLFAVDPWRAAAHDLAHVFLEGNYPTTTSWFDEGLAEYFSSIQLDNKRIDIGGDPELRPFLKTDIFDQTIQKQEPPKPLTDFLLAPIWINMADLLTMQRTGPEGTHRTLFHAQSWMTIHYLLAQKKMTETGVFFDLLQNQNVPVEQAIQRAYGMTSKQFEQAVKDYFKAQKDLFAARDEAQQAVEVTVPQPYQYPSPIDLETVTYSVKPLKDPEGRVAVAEMEARLPEHRADAQADIRTMMHECPQRECPETSSEHRVLGWIALETKQWDTAMEEFASAMELNPKEYWSRYYLAVTKFREAQATNQPIKGLANALLDLRVVIDWYPDFAEAHSLLGLGRVEGGGITSAAEAMQVAIRLNPRHEWYQVNLARIYTEAKKFDAARALLDHLKLSGDPQIAAAAKQQIKDLAITQKYGISPEHARAQAQAAAEEAAREAKDAAENVRPVEAPPDKRPILLAKGRIVSVDCSQEPAALMMFAAGNRTLKLHAADKSKVIVIGEDAFSCRWESVRAQANYKARAKAGEGDLVSVEVQ
jgi:tetratricopeptide (TPR) repeat protein